MNYHAQTVIYEHKQQAKIKKLEEFFGASILEIIEKYHLPHYMYYIMKGEEEFLKKHYGNIYKSIKSCAHASDSRSLIQYAKDIVMAWVFETYVMKNLQNHGLDIVRNGGDKDYQFLHGTEISSESDFMVGMQRIELICNYTDYWSKHGCIDLRESKAKHLYQSESLVLGITLQQEYCLIIDFSKYLPNEYIENYPPFGGKSAHRIMITTDMKVPVNFTLIVQKIKEMMEKQDNEARLLDFGYQESLKSYFLKCDSCKIPLFYKTKQRPTVNTCPKCKKTFTNITEVKQ